MGDLRLDWSELNPVVNYANDLRCAPGFAFGPRRISNYQLIYVVSGKGRAVIGGRPYPAERGDLFYYGPDVVHFFEADRQEPFRLYGVHFHWRAALEEAGIPPFLIDCGKEGESASGKNAMNIVNAAQIGNKGPDGLRIEDRSRVADPELPQLLRELVASYREGGDGSAVLCRGLMLHALLLLRRGQTGEPRRASPHERMLQAVRDRLRGQAELPYRREWLTEWTGYHADYAARLFAEHYGEPPHDYHAREKVGRAKELLEQTELSVGEIAERLHWSSIHYFSRSFKARTGHTPLGYRSLSRLV